MRSASTSCVICWSPDEGAIGDSQIGTITTGFDARLDGVLLLVLGEFPPLSLCGTSSV
jgi:hypothetical protein